MTPATWLRLLLLLVNEPSQKGERRTMKNSKKINIMILTIGLGRTAQQLAEWYEKYKKKNKGSDRLKDKVVVCLCIY